MPKEWKRSLSTIEDIGSLEKLIASLGPFVTRNTFDPEELLETSVEKVCDQTINFLFIAYVVWTLFFWFCLLENEETEWNTQVISLLMNSFFSYFIYYYMNLFFYIHFST